MTTLQPAKPPVVDLRIDRIESAPVKPAARPELVPPKAVTAAPRTEPSRGLTREPPIDPQTREAIMRAIGESARQARPVPEKAMQRSRAYTRAARLDEQPPPRRSDLSV